MWKSTTTKEFAATLSTNDVHSANKVRVNRTIVNFPELYETYGIKPGMACLSLRRIASRFSFMILTFNSVIARCIEPALSHLLWYRLADQVVRLA
ncbi:M13-type metalloendopeptidase [Paenibacillus elgii]